MAGGPYPSVAARGAERRYAAALGVTVAAILSQYFVPVLFPAAAAVYGNLGAALFIVYGIPIAAFAVLVGAGPIARWRLRMAEAAWQGLRWYGAMMVLALVVTVAIAAVYAVLDPGALALLNRPNPALQAAAGNPWFFVGFSFVVGAVEETIFRGWVFGFWSGRRAGWVAPAILSSALFAGLHLYYGTTYGIASPLIFPQLVLAGFAFAATFEASGGNLVVVALLHGALDASAYLTLIDTPVALGLRYGLIAVGFAVALADAAIRSRRGGRLGIAEGRRTPALPWRPAPVPPDRPM
ncbi:MAG: type II CAAX endopeptidase family protein [Thermoplasmata archaeon]